MAQLGGGANAQINGGRATTRLARINASLAVSTPPLASRGAPSPLLPEIGSLAQALSVCYLNQGTGVVVPTVGKDAL